MMKKHNQTHTHPINDTAPQLSKHIQPARTMSASQQQRPLKDVLKEALLKAVNAHQNGEIDIAMHLYKEVMKFDKTNPVCLHYLGVAHKQKGNHQDAITLISKAIEQKPDWVDAYYNLAIAYREIKELDKAIIAAEHGLKVDPNKAQIHSLLAIIYNMQDKADKGLKCADKAIKINPNMREAWINRGINLYRLARFEEAQKAYEKAISLNPAPAEPYNNIGAIYLMRGLYKDAFPWFQKALEHNDKYAEAYNNIATCYRQADQYGHALINYEKSLESKEDFIDALCNKANMQRLMGLLDDAKETYEKVIRLAPEVVDNYCNYLMSLHYMDNISQQEIYDKTRQWEKIYCSNLETKPRKSFTNDRDPNRRLRVGLVSSSFRRHPVGYMILPALDHMDQSKVEWIGYSAVGNNKADDLTDRIRDNCAEWKSTMGLTHKQIAELCREDKVDILLDLTGHSEGSSLIAFAHRGAPIQVEWIGGLFDTSGIEEMDWIIGDAIEIPEGDEKWYTEKVYRMPHDYICYEPPHYAPPVSDLPALKNGYITFGNFNNLAKTTPTSIRIWAQIMGKVPDSRLFLKTKGLSEDIVQRNIREQFIQHGIDGDRLIFEGASKHEEHIQCFERVDISLDPFPYTGGLTTCESLWMGVPTITLPGPTFAGKHAATHLHTAGYDDWITDSEQAYIDLAIYWSNNLTELANLRTGMRDQVQKSPLVNGQSFAQDLQDAFRHMWHEWCEQTTEQE